MANNKVEDISSSALLLTLVTQLAQLQIARGFSTLLKTYSILTPLNIELTGGNSKILF